MTDPIASRRKCMHASNDHERVRGHGDGRTLSGKKRLQSCANVQNVPLLKGHTTKKKVGGQ